MEYWWHIRNILYTDVWIPPQTRKERKLESNGETTWARQLCRFSVISLLFSSSLSRVRLFAAHCLQHVRPPCPSPTPGAYPNSCPLSRCIQPSHPLPSLFLLLSVFPSIRVFFQWVSSLHQRAKAVEFQLQYQSFQWIFRTDFLQDGLVGSPCCPRDSQESSPIQSSKASFLWHSAFFIVQLSHPYLTTGNPYVQTTKQIMQRSHGLCSEPTSEHPKFFFFLTMLWGLQDINNFPIRAQTQAHGNESPES